MTADDLRTTHVVSVFLRHDADVLLLYRSDKAGSDSGRWGAVAGHAEGDSDTAACEEIHEGTGLDPAVDVTDVRSGTPFDVEDPDLGTRWIVHPHLFDAGTREITTNEETTESEWVPPTEIRRRDTAPGLWTSYDRVRPAVESVASDRDHGSAYLSIRALEVLRDESAVAEASDGADWTELVSLARDLRDARPSMPVVANRVNRAMHAATTENGSDGGPGVEAVEAAAIEGIRRALDADDRAAARAAERLPARVATLSRSGTVLRALERAAPEFVLVAESRPGGEGVATAEVLVAETDAAVTVTSDAAFGDQLVATDVGALVVGADAVLPDGGVVNKVGTRAAASVAAQADIDCYVVAATDKVRSAGAGGAVDPKERDPGELYDGDADVRVANPTFAATSGELVDAVVTEHGVLDSDGIARVAAEHRERAAWDG